MGCCDEDSVQVSKMALELKSGPMLWHKRRFFGSNWRDVHSVLYNDSSLLWYTDKSRQDQVGGLVLKDAPELIAFGVYTSQVPNRPPLPDNYEPKELLAFGVRGKDVVYWFLCPNEEEVGSWMAAIVSSMPPPQASPQAPPPQQEMGNSPSPGMVLPQPYVPQYQPQQPPPQYTPNQQAPAYNQGTPGIPGQYPPPVPYRPTTYQNTVHPQPQPYAHPYPGGGGGGGPTTVIVQQDRPGYIGGGGGGGGDFAMGMLLGGAIGTAWGSHTHHGFGLGGGFGHGGGWGHGTSVHDHTNVTVNNYYDNDTTTVNNNLDMTNNVAIEQAAVADVPQMPPVEQAVPEQSVPIMENDIPPQYYREQAFPQPVPSLMAEEYAPVQEYVPMEDTSGGMFGGGDYGGGDYGGGDYNVDFGGGDFGGGDFGDF